MLYFIRVDDDLRVQITDNALARDLFPQDYHCLGDNENRPIKWLAIESLLNKAFSTASDVVSISKISKIFCSHNETEVTLYYPTIEDIKMVSKSMQFEHVLRFNLWVLFKLLQLWGSQMLLNNYDCSITSYYRQKLYKFCYKFNINLSLRK